MQIEMKSYTIEEYLLAEEKASIKSEYHSGEILNMAGTSPPHNLIVGNLITSLNNCLKKTDYKVYPSDRLLYVQNCVKFYYPDVTVVCGAEQIYEGQKYKLAPLLNPLILIEVLSESTASQDRGSKFYCYQTIESLNQILLIDSERLAVESYTRQKKKVGNILTSKTSINLF